MGADGVLLLREDAAEGEHATRADRVDEVVGVDAEDVADDISQYDVGPAGQAEAFFEAGVMKGYRLIGDTVVFAIGDADADGFRIVLSSGGDSGLVSTLNTVGHDVDELVLLFERFGIFFDLAKLLREVIHAVVDKVGGVACH